MAPPPPAAMAPLRRDNRAVERVRPLDLEPLLPPLPDRVRRVELLCHEPLVAGFDRFLQESLNLRTARRYDPLREDLGRREPLEGGPPPPGGRGGGRAGLDGEGSGGGEPQGGG